MAYNTTGLCVLCNIQVTEDDHRREIDCPSKSCPGRIYHEDCISTYLRRTKYSKDRCTGFPCPAVLSTGKQCPGYVCKMHTFFPSNQKKKQARLEAAIAAAAAPKPRLKSVKPKAGAQAAMAAMKRAVPEGCAIADRRPGALMSSDVQEPRFIPGYDPEDPSADLRARGAKNKAQTVVGNVQRSLSDVSGVWPDGSFDSGGSERAPHATVWDAFTTAPGIGGDLNYFDLERHNHQYSGQRSGGQFSAFLQERLNGAPKAFLEQADAKSLREWGFTTPKRGAEVSRSAHANDSANQDALLALSASPETEAHNEWGAMGGVDGGTQSDTTRAVVAADQDDDPVIEYDALYGADDGSHLVLDTVTNAFFRPVDLYGEPPELVEFPGEDGSVYTYVAVRKSMVEARVQRQQAWFDAQEQLQLQQAQQPQQALEMHVQQATAEAEMYRAAEGCGTSSPSGNIAGVLPVPCEEPEEAAQDVESLMRLLGM